MRVFVALEGLKAVQKEPPPILLRFERLRPFTVGKSQITRVHSSTLNIGPELKDANKGVQQFPGGYPALPQIRDF